MLPLALLLVLPARADLDVAFVLDTTGSMSGELQEARTRVTELAEALQAARPQERIRFAVVAYRDQGDAYVTQVSPLSPEIEATHRFLRGLSANGGGDSPEDVIEGVRVALQDLDWDPAAEKQLFLVGDAPPHTDYADHLDLPALSALARDQGVVVNAIGCRSLSTDGIAWFRDLAYATEGQYHHIGRVEADQGGLADAMLQTLAPAPGDDGPLRPVEVYETRSGAAPEAEHPLAGGIVVRLGAWWSALEKAPELPGEACALSVLLPEGMTLAAPPEVGLGRARLHVELSLAPGEGQRTVWELEQCVPRSLPVETSLL